MTENSQGPTQDVRVWRGSFGSRLKDGAQTATIRLAQAAIFFGGLFVGFRVLSLIIVLLAGDPASIRNGADAGAISLRYIRKAIAAEYLPPDDEQGNLPPKPGPSPEASPSPTASTSPSPKAAKK